uniref:Ycf66-like protein n=1 Tax=Paulinella chromatophora TaxID=39717 RepID=B1X570_PAUCH|nr:hypothetical protein PCC_0670 [Paulinella chromatophora]ACB43089.1 hypothetical protein PCC_0670 [Paulinella chromatophora]
MVNASLNWASIIGIVLAAGGALLYFMRSFKPELARDYDVFFAAIGLLCGGILFFQGWRLDPILQFGQFLLAGTTVFFAYESVRLRGITTEQARRASYFDEDDIEPSLSTRKVRGGWEKDSDRFDQPQYIRRQIGTHEQERTKDDDYRPLRPSRPVIPERAVSRRGNINFATDDSDWAQNFSSTSNTPNFGERRIQRQEIKRGSRPIAIESNSLPRSRRFNYPNSESSISISDDSSTLNNKNNIRGNKKHEPIDTEIAPIDSVKMPINNRIKSKKKLEGKSEEERKREKQSNDEGIRDNTSRFDN